MFEQAFEYRLYVALPHGADDWRRLVDYVKATLQGATIQSATGIWQGDQEYSIVITVVAHCRDNGRRCASLVAADLKQMFDQDCVMVTETPIRGVMAGTIVQCQGCGKEIHYLFSHFVDCNPIANGDCDCLGRIIDDANRQHQCSYGADLMQPSETD